MTLVRDIGKTHRFCGMGLFYLCLHIRNITALCTLCTRALFAVHGLVSMPSGMQWTIYLFVDIADGDEIVEKAVKNNNFLEVTGISPSL